jgi:hypothetical protein
MFLMALRHVRCFCRCAESVFAWVQSDLVLFEVQRDQRITGMQL